MMNRSGILFWVLLATVWLWTITPLMAENEGTTEDTSTAIHTAIVWSDSDGSDSEIFLTYIQNGTWQGPVQLTDNASSDILPAACISQDGTIDVVWTKISGSNSRLKWLRYADAAPSSSTTIDTGMSSNTSPVLMVDAEGGIGVVFTGFDGQDDDIFFAPLTDGAWESPQRISTDDAMPDITPLVTLNDSGQIRVTWIGFSTGGKYLAYSALYENGSWSSETEAGSEDLLEQLRVSSLDSSLEIPGYVNSKTASVFVFGNQGGASLPLRNM